MLRLVLFAIASFFVVLSGSTWAQAKNDEDVLPIVNDGKPQAIIITSDNSAYRTRQAVGILIDYVERSTGARLPTMSTSTFEANPGDYLNYTRLYVDEIPSKYEAQIAAGLQGLDDQGFLIFPRGQTMTIIGPTIWGTLHGVYDFLERFVGIRWLMIGSVGEDVPEQLNIDVPNIDVREQPAFTYRVLWNPFHGEDPYLPVANNKEENQWAHRNKLQGSYNYGMDFGHNLHTIFPPEKYGKTNPEFYPQGNPPPPGERLRWQPCFSVPQTVDVAVEYILGFFDQNPNEKSFRLSVNDIGGFCEEDPSHPAYTGKRNSSGYMDMSDIYYRWVNAVVEQVTEVYPEKWFTLSSYREVMDPPSFPLHPQILPRITKDRMTWIDDDIQAIGHNQMEAWSQVASQIAWYDYMYGSSYHVPRVYPRHLVSVFRYAKEQNVAGWYIENQYHAAEGPKAWILAKLLWNPNQDIEALLTEWYERAVGPEAAEDLAAFYDHWENFWMERIPGTPWFETGKVGTYLQFPDPTYLNYVTDEDIIQTRRLLDAVVAKAETEQQRERAELIREGFAIFEAKALSYPRVMRIPNGEEAARAFVDELVLRIDQRIGLAERRYDLHREFRNHFDRNLRIRISFENDYWWSHWTGWNSLDLRMLVNYLAMTEQDGGPVTDRLKAFAESENSAERRLAYFVNMTQGDYVKAPPLTENSSFEYEVSPAWTLDIAGNGTIKPSKEHAFTGETSLRLAGVSRGIVSQVFPLEKGLTGVQVHYYVPAGIRGGTIRLILDGLSPLGDVLATVATQSRSLIGPEGEWSSLELIDVLSPLLAHHDIVQGRVTVTIEGAAGGTVYIDDIVAYQQFPVGAEVIEVETVDTIPNVALGKPVKSDSARTLDGHRFAPERAVDGVYDNDNSRWQSLNSSAFPPPHWIEIDLQGSYLIDSAIVWTGIMGPEGPDSARAGVRQFKLQYWKDGNWEDIPGASVDNNPTRNGKVELEFTEAVVTDKVRLFTPVSDLVRFREVKVLGVPAP